MFETPRGRGEAKAPLEVPEGRPRSAWDAWGSTPAQVSSRLQAMLANLLGESSHAVPRRAFPKLTPPRLHPDDRRALESVVGEAQVSTTDADRMLHLGGKSTSDLLWRRLGDTQQPPDVIVSPADHDEVAALLVVCAMRDLVVIPFGGGTSVVGGVNPEAGGDRPVVSVDLARTAALLAFDETSLLATLGAGTTGPQAEVMLNQRGFTLGHFPQSFEYASVGGFAATRSSGQASRRYGRFDEIVHAIRVATPAGALALGRAPASAAGPDLRQLFLGSEGAFGVITEMTVRVRPLPAATTYAAWILPSFAAGADAVREATQRGLRPAVIRLSDHTETQVSAAIVGQPIELQGCLAIATCEAEDTDTAEATAAALDRIFHAHGATALGGDPARSWERGRFAGPGLRDTLLDLGVLVETVETATTWDRLLALKHSVTDALSASLAGVGVQPVVLCHISHVYPAGASLYFTVVASLTRDPIEQWAKAKDAASRAIVDGGGTITHHHAVGRDHRNYLEDEIGTLGVDILRATKRVLDPTGIMNPGVLITPHRTGPNA